MSRRALVLAAHGSQYNPLSSRSARQHAQRLAARGLFDQVIAAFWKESPSLRDVRYLLDADEAVIVPLFMADGYFASRVVPRELELAGEVTARAGLVLHYTLPVGTDPTLREVILSRARGVLGANGPETTAVALLVIGHGTVQNPRSKESVLAHVARLRESGWFKSVHPAYLDESPTATEALAAIDAAQVVVVPLFVSDGLHPDRDIPEELGLHRGENGWCQPSRIGKQQVWYTPAVGSDPSLCEVILARAVAALGPLEPLAEPPRPPRWATAFAAELAELARPLAYLQVLVTPTGVGRFELRHVDDAGERELRPADPAELAQCDADGRYRPLPTAPNLRGGWRSPDLSVEQVIDRLETLYPGGLANRAAVRSGRLALTSWRELAGRQTGQLGLVKRVTDEDLAAAATACCTDAGCLRQRLWQLAPDEPLGVAAGDGLVPCGEPCGQFTAFVRKVVGYRRDELVPSGSEPRWQRFFTALGEPLPEGVSAGDDEDDEG